jgi:hypothetical protein
MLSPRLIVVFLLSCMVISIDSQQAVSPISDADALRLQINENELKEQIKLHSDLIDEFFPNKQQNELFNKYRIEYPHPEDYVISMLINPCGVNGTHGGIDRSIARGYDCCMNQFGRGEYGFLKYVNGNGSEMTDIAVFEKRILASHDEVLHNIITVV